ncbi:MAG: hypothetical protein Q9194_003921 [Teloschistes cf. exilis]
MVKGAAGEKGDDGEEGGQEELYSVVPWERVVFDAQVVCEETDDAGHNYSGDELSEAEKVEGERVVGGWVLGYLRGRHYFIGTGD